MKTVEEGEFFGPMVEYGRTVPFKESLDLFMERVDDWRRDELYPHNCTSSECAKRGCEKVIVVDGLWKLGRDDFQFCSKILSAYSFLSVGYRKKTPCPHVELSPGLLNPPGTPR